MFTFLRDDDMTAFDVANQLRDESSDETGDLSQIDLSAVLKDLINTPTECQTLKGVRYGMKLILTLQPQNTTSGNIYK